ncbi:MAG: ABC transporter permease subunit [Methylococcales bacterium]|nr:ABC transporter permease subunit [Methylococcales bacterium]
MKASVIRITSLGIFVLLWQTLAWWLHDPALPGPWQVFSLLIEEAERGALWRHLGATLMRMLVSFSVAMAIGCGIGLGLGLSRCLDVWFYPWLMIILNVPALVTIILCYVWLGLTETAALLAVVLNKTPNVAITLREGVRALDQELLAMARCYRLGWRKTLHHVIWPQLHPYLMAATRSGLALIWKIILVVELLGRSEGVGYQLHLFFQLFDVAGILAYTVAFLGIIGVIELAILKPLDRYQCRWRT